LAVRKESLVLREESLIRITGPAKIQVKKGTVYLLGLKLAKGKSITVGVGRTLALKAMENSELELLLGPAGKAEPADPREEVLDNWIRAAEMLSREGVIVVLGETDSGKSTFSTFIINTALEKGLKVAFIDTDLGQKDVGYPGTVTLTFPKQPLTWIRSLQPYSSKFIGNITPYNAEECIIASTLKLLREARSKADLIVINTDGWVVDEKAVKYKTSLISAINPDKIAVMKGFGQTRFLTKTLEKMHYKVFNVPSPPSRPLKTRSQRKFYRETAFASMLLSAQRLNINIRACPILNIPLGLGERYLEAELKIEGLLNSSVYVERLHNIATVITIKDFQAELLKQMRSELCRLLKIDTLSITSLEALRSLYIGLHDKQRNLVGLGIIESFDIEKSQLLVWTNIRDPSQICYILAGSIKITKQGEEKLKKSFPCFT